MFFLDEPTSGLDSRAALIVMREVKKVANLGRTVITTVHQPSKEIFNLFDDMLLLQRGGYQVYFGPCGVNGKTFVDYLQKIPNAHALPDGMNPASWMLDVLQFVECIAVYVWLICGEAIARIIAILMYTHM